MYTSIPVFNLKDGLFIWTAAPICYMSNDMVMSACKHEHEWKICCCYLQNCDIASCLLLDFN